MDMNKIKELIANQNNTTDNNVENNKEDLNNKDTNDLTLRDKINLLNQYITDKHNGIFNKIGNAINKGNEENVGLIKAGAEELNKNYNQTPIAPIIEKGRQALANSGYQADRELLDKLNNAGFTMSDMANGNIPSNHEIQNDITNYYLDKYQPQTGEIGVIARLLPREEIKQMIAAGVPLAKGLMDKAAKYSYYLGKDKEALRILPQRGMENVVNAPSKIATKYMEPIIKEMDNLGFLNNGLSNNNIKALNVMAQDAYSTGHQGVSDIINDLNNKFIQENQMPTTGDLLRAKFNLLHLMDSDPQNEKVIQKTIDGLDTLVGSNLLDLKSKIGNELFNKWKNITEDFDKSIMVRNKLESQHLKE